MTSAKYLATLAETLTCRIYFVLGNHDFTFGQIAGVHSQYEQVMRALFES